MRAVSNTNVYFDSEGNRYTSSQVENLIRKAKEQVYWHFMNKWGYIFCVDCKRSNGVRIDMSHTKSVYDCKKDREVEKSWDSDNIRPRCRSCHNRLDKNGVMWGE